MPFLDCKNYCGSARHACSGFFDLKRDCWHIVSVLRDFAAFALTRGGSLGIAQMPSKTVWSRSPAAKPWSMLNAIRCLVPSDITSLLQRWSAGDPAAIDDLLPLVYDDLRRL